MDKQQREYIHHLMLQYSDATDAISYQHNQEEFFIVSDRQWMKADWENEGIFFSISGQISEDEIKEMIDSIQ